MRALPAIVCLAACLSSALPCAAQDPEGGSGVEGGSDAEERAKALFAEGRDAMERGDYATACERFEDSLELFPRASMFLNLGACNEKLGRLATALRYWQRGLASLQITDRERVQTAKEQIASLEQRAPRLVVALPQKLPARSIVALDDAAVPLEELREPLYVDPGEHRLTLDAPGHGQRRVVVTVVEGQRLEVRLELGEATAPDVITVTEPNEAQLAIGWTLGGVGLAGLILGAVTGGLVLDRKATVEELCADDVCTSPEGVDAADEGRALAIVSTVGIVAGATLVGVGLLLVLTADDGGEVALSVTPRGLALAGRF